MMKPRVSSALLGACLLLGCLPDTAGHRAGDRAETGVPVTTGWVPAAELVRAPEHGDFRERYDTVKVEEPVVGMLQQLSADVDVIVFYGSWCGDSRREVPRFLRIVEKGGFVKERVRYYGLDRTKKSSDGLTDQYEIERVPTFILLRSGKELGRVVELPRTTLEGDMVEILVGARREQGTQPGP
jgi:thiol-disulfide isomerase/thioredoxin